MLLVFTLRLIFLWFYQFLGLGVGVTSVVPPVLLNEIADEASRGIITTLHQVTVLYAISNNHSINDEFVV